MFSSGTEYEVFCATYCENCRRYVDWTDSYEKTKDIKSPDTCPIEYAMAKARFKSAFFPSSFVYRDQNKDMICSEYIKGKHPMLIDDEHYIPDAYWRFEK